MVAFGRILTLALYSAELVFALWEYLHSENTFEKSDWRFIDL